MSKPMLVTLPFCCCLSGLLAAGAPGTGGEPDLSSFPWRVVAEKLPLLALTGISAVALAWRRQFPYLFVGWFWYVGMLVPVIGLLQVGSQSMADRYTYLPADRVVSVRNLGGAQLAASWPSRRLGVHRRFGAGGADSDGICVAADVVLAKQRDALDPNFSLQRRRV